VSELSYAQSEDRPPSQATVTVTGKCVCVYYCRTYYKAVRGGGGGEWRTCAMRDDEPRPVWMDESAHHALVNAGGREIV
jgi:hypothetical protein